MSQEAENARHYANLRFAMFTVFTAILGAVIAYSQSESAVGLHEVASARWSLGITGMLFSVAFGAGDWRVSRLVTHYQEAAFKAGTMEEPGGHLVWNWLALSIMLLPYAASFGYWIVWTFSLIPAFANVALVGSALA